MFRQNQNTIKGLGWRNPFANLFKKSERQQAISDFKDHRKWAMDFINEMAEGRGNNAREIRQQKNRMIKNNPWVKGPITEKMINDAINNNYPEVI